MNVPLLGLGSPLMDRCAVGFRAGASTSERTEIFSALIDAIEIAAQSSGADLTAVKDFGDRDRCWAEPVMQARGYAKMASLPIAVLDLPFANVDEYLEVLSASARKDLRRKQRRSVGSVSFTEYSPTGRLEHEIAELYEATRSNGNAEYGNFDALSPDYVGRVLEGVKGKAKVLLGWVDDVLASFALILVGPGCGYAHQIGMRYPLARENNLYFLNWLAVVRFCIERGIRRLEFGQTCYPLKLRLGCRLEHSSIYFRHRVRPVNAALGYLAPSFGFDRVEPAHFA
jgi:predicted N-acyltransferase